MTAAGKNVTLADLDFGAPAAERDIQRGLEHYFVESEAFKRVNDRKKTILIGNRGSGKSAIFQILAAQARHWSSNTEVIQLFPEDYSYELLRESLETEASGSWAKLGAYAVAWKYLIYVLVMKAVVRDARSLGKNKSLTRINSYLRSNHRVESTSKLSAMVSYLKRLEGVKLGSFEASVKTRQLEKLYKLEEIHHLIPDLIEVLERRKVIVLVDELDRGWDASEDAQAFVAGLFQACIQLNLHSPNLTVYMSLRQELYDNIPALYEDAQKFRDLIELLAWDEKGLRRLIASRIRYSKTRGLSRENPDRIAIEKFSDEDMWNKVFVETLNFRRNKSFNYLVDRTLYRPREMIQFCTTTVEQALNNDNDLPLDYSIISEAERIYSDDRTKDISAEYRFQYPGLQSVFEAFRGDVYTINRDELEYKCLELISLEVATAREAQAWLQTCDPERLIEILWQVGFLRAQTVGGVRGRQRSGSQYVGQHQVGNLNLNNVARFQVHPMFRSALALKEPKGGQSDGN